MTESLLLPTDVGAAMSLREMAYSWEGDPIATEGAVSLDFLVARGLQVGMGLQPDTITVTNKGLVIAFIAKPL